MVKSEHTAAIEDRLILNLGLQLDRCADELGIVGCSRCPVFSECRMLWAEVQDCHGPMAMTSFRKLSMKFFKLRAKRVYIGPRVGSKSR
jgi:hypothetical protein